MNVTKLLTPLLGMTLAFSVLPVTAASASPTPSDPSEKLVELRQEASRLEEESRKKADQYSNAITEAELASMRATYIEGSVSRNKVKLDNAREELGEVVSNLYVLNSAAPESLAPILTLTSPGEMTSLNNSLFLTENVQKSKSDALEAVASAEESLALSQKAALSALEESISQENTAKKLADEAIAASKKADEIVSKLSSEEFDKEQRAKAAKIEEEKRKEEERAALEREARELAREESPFVSEPITGSSSAVKAPIMGNAQVKVALNYAYKQVGKPYILASDGPKGFDCSGLTSAAYRQAGINLPRNSAAQAGKGKRVSVRNLKPGDLVFFGSPIYHVGIYVGDGKMVHATKPGDTVKIAKMWTTPSKAVRLS